MPGIIQLQNQYNPWQRQMPNFLANMVYQTMGQRFREQQANKLAQEREQKELRAYQAAGYRESEAHKPDIEVAGKGLMEPQTTYETRVINGQLYQVPITKKYGEIAGKQSGEVVQVGKTSKLQRKTNYILKDGKVYAQNYNYDPESGTQTSLGPKYLSKVPGSTTLNINDKVTLTKQKEVAKAKVAAESMVKSPKFRSSVIKQLEREDEWEYYEPFEREQAIFDEMDRQVRDAFVSKRITFDEKRQGWYDLDSGKLLRRYHDPYRTKKGVAKSFKYHISPLEDYLNK